MQTDKLFITNRHGMKVAIQVDSDSNSDKLVFIAHGLKGFMGEKHITLFAKSFLKHGFRVVRFDATHSIGESDGDIIDVTYDSYLEDLEDVIAWAKNQSWFTPVFALCGHSMGAQTTTWFAEHHPIEVSMLCAMAPPINYELYYSTFGALYAADWQRTGYREQTSRAKPGLITQVGWGVVTSLRKYDILQGAKNLTMPMLDIVGEFDRPCPVVHQKQFIDAIESIDKTLIVLPNFDHNYREHISAEYDDDFSKLGDALDTWLSEHVA